MLFVLLQLLLPAILPIVSTNSFVSEFVEVWGLFKFSISFCNFSTSNFAFCNCKCFSSSSTDRIGSVLDGAETVGTFLVFLETFLETFFLVSVILILHFFYVLTDH